MLTTLDAAKGMQRKHSKLMRDIESGSVNPPAGLRVDSLHPGRANQSHREAATVLPPYPRRLALPLHGTGYET